MAKASGKRRQEILDAAARIFAEKGYEATSIQDVADAVGILKGSLYYYIDSKEDLLFGVIWDAHHEGLGQLERIVDGDDGALVKLRAAIEAVVRSNIANLRKIGVYFSDFRSLSPERHAEIIASRDAYDRMFRDLIQQGQAEGVISPDLDPKIAAIGILGMVNWIYQWYSPEGPEGAEQIAGTFADLVLGGLATDDGRPAQRRALGAPAPPQEAAS